MTRFEKVITEKREELKKILINWQCPSEFGIENPKYCDISNALTWDCETCWNEETGKEAGGSETIKQEGGEVMIQIGELVSWQTQGGGKKKIRSGIAKAVIEPGQKATEVYPELACVPSTRRNFKLISSVKRVLVEEPRDSFNGRRHYSKFYAPPLATVEKYAKEGR